MGMVPFTPGDHMGDCFFEVAFPGQACRPERPEPWRNHTEYTHLLRAGLDERPYERRTVVPSTWGDIFDVVLNNADPAVLDAYQATVVLGDIRLSDEWLERLGEYANRGGKVMINAAQIPAGHWPKWLGCTTEGLRCRAHDFVTGDALPLEDLDFEVVKIEPGAATVVSSSGEGDPLVVVNQVGAGEVWLLTIPYMVSHEDSGRPSLTGAAQEALEAFLRPLEQIRIDGRPLAHIVNRRGNRDLLLTLGNLDTEQWIGRIAVPAAAAGQGHVRDLWNERRVLNEARGDDLVLHLVLPPWGLAVIEISLAE